MFFRSDGNNILRVEDIESTGTETTIQMSKMSVIVLSNDFASSECCLDELSCVDHET
jgi:hypothetical protein